MDVVFEGAISRSWGMADVLRGIMGVENQPYGILRVSSPGSNVSGRLAIADSQFIVGATVSDGTETGYHAVRRLLMAYDGNFAYLDTGGSKPQDFDQALYISIQKLSDMWPDLPADPADLFDEKSLLDKVFGGTGKMPADPSSGHVPIIRLDEQGPVEPPMRSSLVKAMQDAASAAGAGKSSHKQAWKTVVQPLLSNSLVDDQKTSGAQYFDLDDTASHRQSLTKLRAQHTSDTPWYKELFRESLLSKQAILWIFVILVLGVVATLVGMAAVNQSNSLTIQSGTQERTQP